jgi:hypothetical protein
MMSGKALAPLRLFAPGGGGRVGLLGAPAFARERPRKLRKGDTPLPPRARKRRRPAIHQASVISHATTPISGSRF